MLRDRVLLVLAAALVMAACTPASVVAVRAPDGEATVTPKPEAPDELETLLRADPALAAVLDDAPQRRVEVLVSIPTEDAQGKPSLRRLGFRVDAEYFYPASAVKLPTAVAVLEKLDEQRDARGRRLVDLSTPLRVTEGEGRARKITSTTLRDDLERALVVSDNDANNRLFELVGRDELAERLTRVGLGSTRIVHRLGDSSSASLPAFEWLPPNGEPVYIAQRTGFEPPPEAREGEALVGSAHVDESGRRVAGPMDFAGKNRMSLRDLQDSLVMVVRPDLADGPLPRVAPDDRAVLLSILGMLPTELRGGPHSARSDELNKPLHVALTASLPDDNVRVLGKGGRAFGFAIENSYVIDETTGRSLFVTAVIYANGNGTLNDDRYDYRKVALPFMMRLGETLGRTLLAGPARRE